MSEIPTNALREAALAALENDRHERRRKKAALKVAYRVKPYKSALRPHLKALVRWKNAAGKWEKKFFATKGEAETFAQQRNTEILNQGIEALTFSTELRVVAQKYDGILRARGHTLEEAAKHYIDFLDRTERSKKTAVAYREFFEERKGTGVSKKYLILLESVTGKFAAEFGEKSLSEITTDDCQSWLANRGGVALTRNNYRRKISHFFHWARRRRYCAENPAEIIPVSKVVETPVGILSVEQLGRLLALADTQMLAYVAIGAFAGLRSAELHRLDWSEIDLTEGFIHVKAEKAKSARRRVVKIQPALAAWLRPIAKRSGSLFDMKSVFPALRELWTRAGMADWPRNALRHSFASYHLARFRNAAELALEMGHTRQNLIFSHYRQIVSEADAARYWEIMPTEPENVLSIAEGNFVPRKEHGYVHTPEGRFAALPKGGIYQRTAREYAEQFGVTEKAANHWMRQGRPLDDLAALARLERGEYLHSVDEHAEIYGVSAEQIRLWRRFAWPLDNVEGMKSYLSTRKLWRPAKQKTPPKLPRNVVSLAATA